MVSICFADVHYYIVFLQKTEPRGFKDEASTFTFLIATSGNQKCT